MMHPLQARSGIGDAIATLYSALADWMDTTPWYLDENIAERIKSLILIFGPSSRILELCCGTGRILRLLSKSYNYVEIIGVDLSSRMVGLAKTRNEAAHNVNVINGDWIYDLPASMGRFDVVLVKNALHLIDNLSKMLKDLYLVSNPHTALIIVETVSPDIVSNKFIKGLFGILDDQRVKQNFFTERSLKKYMHAGDWEVDSKTDVFVDQYIDVDSWLMKKAVDACTLREARRWLADANVEIRNSMKFDTPRGLVPSRMLRRQYIGRYFRSVTDLVINRAMSEPNQLNLHFTEGEQPCSRFAQDNSTCSGRASSAGGSARGSSAERRFR